MTRREWLIQTGAMAASACAGGCAAGGPGTGGVADAGQAFAAAEACGDLPPPDSGWHAIPLAEIPGLASQGVARVRAREALLQVWVVRESSACHRAVWAICTHGACELDWKPEERWLECPCHGSRFNTLGAIVRGPATQPVRTLPAQVREGYLYIKRPF
ncbi:MAG: Cytochrome b6-f complex iron-sulfur subunit [Myxococcota bacterium]|nr:Cytochrome b6-f complex iron-sulfur subunit [Myxococcota bacterium]